jgi:hypothetical protein
VAAPATARTARAHEGVANDDRKSAIVATISRKRAKLLCAERTVERDEDPEATALVKAFLAGMIRPGSALPPDASE